LDSTLEIKEKTINSLNEISASFLYEDSIPVSQTEQLESELNSIVSNFRKVYVHSKELSRLAKILSINQGVKSTLEKVYEVTRVIPNNVSSQQRAFFSLQEGVDLASVDNLIEYYKALDLYDNLDASVRARLKVNLTSNFGNFVSLDTPQSRQEIKNIINTTNININFRICRIIDNNSFKPRINFLYKSFLFINIFG